MRCSSTLIARDPYSRGVKANPLSPFLHCGPGYGGSCLPKDTRALLTIAENNCVSPGIVNSAVEANEAQKARMVERIKKEMGGIRGKTLAILGLSFKPKTNDLREAPAFSDGTAVIETLTIR
jgi:UDPglucose 6-dehydrogenase